MNVLVTMREGGNPLPYDLDIMVRNAGVYAPMIFETQEAKDYYDMYAFMCGRDTTEWTYVGKQESYKQDTPPCYVSFPD